MRRMMIKLPLSSMMLMIQLFTIITTSAAFIHHPVTRKSRIKGSSTTRIYSRTTSPASSVIIIPSSSPTKGVLNLEDQWWARGVERVPSPSPDDHLRAKEGEGKLRLKGMSLKQLEGMVESLGHGREKAKQLFRWMYHKHHMINHIHEAGSTATKASFRLSQALCQQIDSIATVDGGLVVDDVREAIDGTKKLVFKITSGPAQGKAIEAVIIPMVRGMDQRPRYTLCISSQAGCAMSCSFCVTGKLGLLGSLPAGQIVEQLIAARRYLRSIGDDKEILRIVFMGMGEPFDNYDNLMKALEVLTEPQGKLLIGHKKLTVSTVGVVDKIDRFCTESKSTLAVSLHATTNEIRNSFMPINRRYPLEALMKSLHHHFAIERGDGPRKGPLAIEYVMLKGINDSLEDAERLAQMTEGLDCVLNLIEFNTHDGALFQPSPKAQIAAFRAILKSHGRLSTLRKSKGDDEMSACGQLGDLTMARSRKAMTIPEEPPSHTQQ